LRDAVGLASAFAVILALLLPVPGCSEDETGGVLVAPCLDFNPGTMPVSQTVTTRLSDDSSCNVAALEIVATGVDDVWALDTTVTFDTELVFWTGYSTSDSVLGADGAAVVAVVESTAAGELTVGVTRVAPAGA
jgi:hypothetical protein